MENYADLCINNVMQYEQFTLTQMRGYEHIEDCRGVQAGVFYYMNNKSNRGQEYKVSSNCVSSVASVVAELLN
jgi:hypothetical protein